MVKSDMELETKLRRKELSRQRRLNDSLQKWVNHHSNPNEPTLIVGDQGYTPFQILEEVRSNSELGRELSHHLLDSARQYRRPLEAFIKG